MINQSFYLTLFIKINIFSHGQKMGSVKKCVLNAELCILKKKKNEACIVQLKEIWILFFFL